MLFASKTNQEMKTVLAKNGGEAIAFTPNSVLVIAQDNDSGFCKEGEEILILFNSQNTHGRDCLWCTFFMKRPIFPRVIFLKCPESFNSLLLFIITL